MHVIARVVLSAMFLVAAPAFPASTETAPSPRPLDITTELLGDTADGVATRITIKLQNQSDAPTDTPLEIQGSILQDQKVVRNFHYVLQESDRAGFSSVQVLPPGKVTIEARLLIPLEEGDRPVLVAKGIVEKDVTQTGHAYVAAPNATADAIIAEGVMPVSANSIRILPPRRDVAPNLFIVDVEVKSPVKRVEFWVEGKKIQTKNAPPYRAELDLGTLPRRVEVRAVGYDAAGRYVDADAWVVNERSNPVEAKITRTTSPDGLSHFKISVQNNDGGTLAKVVLFAGDKEIAQWTHAPYAIDYPTVRLQGFDFVRTSVYDAKGSEVASDLLFLDGSRYVEQVEVNMIELPVSVFDRSGNSLSDLKKESFTVLEDGKAQKISTFNFASNLPLSLGLLVDHSGSMKPRIETARKAALDFFSQIIGPKDKAFFGGFSWQANHLSPFLSDVGALTTEVGAMPDADGGTALYDAIVSGLYRFRDLPGRKALVIVTDGEDTTSRISYDEMLKYVRAARVPVYFIGIGMPMLGSSKIKGLATETGGVAYLIKDVSQLKETYEKLEKELRSQYLLGYYSEATKKDQKYRSVEVKVDRPDAVVRTIRGYIP